MFPLKNKTEKRLNHVFENKRGQCNDGGGDGGSGGGSGKTAAAAAKAAASHTLPSSVMT